MAFFDPKMVTLKGKKVTSFSDIPKQEKTHVLQQWQWIAFGSAKPAQDEQKNKKKNETNKCKNNNTQ